LDAKKNILESTEKNLVEIMNNEKFKYLYKKRENRMNQRTEKQVQFNKFKFNPTPSQSQPTH